MRSLEPMIFIKFNPGSYISPVLTTRANTGFQEGGVDVTRNYYNHPPEVSFLGEEGRRFSSIQKLNVWGGGWIKILYINTN